MQSGWNVKAVWELADVKGGKRLPKGRNLQKFATPYPYIRVADMTHGTVNLSDIHYVPSDVAPSIRKYRIFSDDIFISVAGTLGIVGKIPEDLNGAYLTENADRLTDIKCDRDYLMYVLQSDSIQREINSIRTVGAQPKLALGRIKDFEILLPEDRQEQSRIARALNAADTFLKELEKIITKKRVIKQGLMQELLTGKTRLPGFDSTWKKSSFGAELEFLRGSMATKELKHGQVPLIAAGIKPAGFVNKANRRGPVITISSSGANAGFVGWHVSDIWASDCTTVSRARGLDLKLAFYLLVYMQDSIYKSQTGGAQPHVHAKDVAPIKIRFPNDPLEQSAIVEVIGAAEAEIQALEKQLESAKAIKQGMMQELLTGRTRLPKEGQ
jgi:type I restriction-modification system specificity subunit